MYFIETNLSLFFNSVESFNPKWAVSISYFFYSLLELNKSIFVKSKFFESIP